MEITKNELDIILNLLHFEIIEINNVIKCSANTDAKYWSMGYLEQLNQLYNKLDKLKNGAKQ